MTNPEGIDVYYLVFNHKDPRSIKILGMLETGITCI
jgi:hypothetical protein